MRIASAPLFIALTCTLGTGCPHDPGFQIPVGDLDLDPDQVLAALEACDSPDAPCLLLTQAYAESADVDLLGEESTLGVFDAGQGGVATWLSLLVRNVPESYPKLQIAVEVGPSLLNVPNTLKVPFVAGPHGTYARTQFMIQFIKPCCAVDFQDLPSTVTATLLYEDCLGLPETCGAACDDESDCLEGYLCTSGSCAVAPLTIQVPVLLDEAPWPFFSALFPPSTTLPIT